MVRWLNRCKNHILHRLYGLIDVITLPELVTQPQVSPHILAHVKLVTRVSISGYLCNIYDPPTLYEKKNHFFNMDHILHRLDDLTDVIWVILSKKKYITPIVCKNRCNIFFFTLFWSSRCKNWLFVIATSVASNVCHVQRVSTFRDSLKN